MYWLYFIIIIQHRSDYNCIEIYNIYLVIVFYFTSLIFIIICYYYY